MLINNPHSLYEQAFREGWALGSFNTSNLEMTQAIAWGLQEKNSPGIIQTSESAIEYAGLVTLHDIISDVAKSVSVPVFLHLDHGRSFEIAEKCIHAGYKSVMIDGSKLSFDENVALTKKVVELAHQNDVWVEGEIGAIQGKEGMVSADIKMDDSMLTDPTEAVNFVAATGVDSLAVSVGTIHGAFRGEEKIRFERLREIHKVVKVPLVLHGASGLPPMEISQAVRLGIAKVNIDTELREAFHDSLEGVVTSEALAGQQKSVDPRKMLTPARKAVQAVVAEKVALLGSADKV
jgi:fructose-bisphosphate aldolase class II